MVWNTTNYKGEPVTWYSENDIENLKNALLKIKGVCHGVYTRTNEAKVTKKVILEIVEGALNGIG